MKTEITKNLLAAAKAVLPYMERLAEQGPDGSQADIDCSLLEDAIAAADNDGKRA